MRYLLSYFALIIGLSGLGMMVAGEALGFFLLLVAAALVYWIIRLQRERQRERHYGRYAPAIEGYEKHFAAVSRELEAKLPEDALDNPALVALLSGEDAARSEQICADYARLRQRFLDWQQDAGRLQEQSDTDAVGLPGPFAENYARLDRELSELLEEVAHLEDRAANVKDFAQDPLEEIARAALKLEQATSECRAAFGEAVPGNLAADLRLGTGKLEQARGGLEKGAERPLVAARLARDAYALAEAVSRRARDLVEHPREVSERRAQLEGEAKRLVDQVSAARAKLGLAAAHYAPACLQPIEGLDAGADQALGHARSLIGSAAAAPDDTLLAEAANSLERTSELVGRIESHLSGLERAAAGAPALVEQAELAIDRAWASGRASGEVEAGRDQIVARAQELAKGARDELGAPRPDWFRATSLARRALEMVGDLGPVPQANRAPALPSAVVEKARQAAEAALAEIRPLVGSVEKHAGADNMAALYLERAHGAYSEGVKLQDEIPGAQDPDAVTSVALDNFRLAVEAANAAEEHAVRLQVGTAGPAKPRWARFGAAFESD